MQTHRVMENEGKIKSSFQMIQRQTLSRFKSGFNHLRDSGQLLDVQIKVGERTFDCHKVVLCAFSEYFKAMFTTARMRETKQNIVELQLLEPDNVRIALDFVYMDKLCLTLDNFKGVLTTGLYLQIDSLIQRFVQDIPKLIDDNSLMDIWSFTSNYPTLCSKIIVTCLNVALHNFENVVKSSNFIAHPEGHMLFSRVLNVKDLEVKSEETVVWGLVNWVMHDPTERKKYLPELLEHVRLPLVAMSTLNALKQSCPPILERQCYSYLEEAERHQSDPARRMDWVSPRTTHRHSVRKALTMCALVALDTFRGVNLADPVIEYRLTTYCSAMKEWIMVDMEIPFECVPEQAAAICHYGESDVFFADGENSCGFYMFTNFADGMGCDKVILEQFQRRRSGHCLVAVKNNLYLLAGSYFTNNPDDTSVQAEKSAILANNGTRLFEPLVEVFNVPSRCWVTGSNPTIPVPVENCVATVQDDLIYLLGTKMKSAPYNLGGDRSILVQRINITRGTCYSLFSLNMDIPLAAVKYNSDIILSTKSHVFKFDPLTTSPEKKLEEIGTIISSEFTFQRPSCVMKYDNTLLIVGGSRNDDGILVYNKVQEFNMATKVARILTEVRYPEDFPPLAGREKVIGIAICPLVFHADILMGLRYLYDA